MEEEKISKQKPYLSFNRWLSVAQNLRGTWQQPRKMLKFYFIEEHDNEYYGIYEVNTRQFP